MAPPTKKATTALLQEIIVNRERGGQLVNRIAIAVTLRCTLLP